MHTLDIPSLRDICAEPYALWLDSATPHSDIATRSFAACSPAAILTSRHGRVRIERTAGGSTQHTGDPFEALRQLLAEFSRRPESFAAGYLGYGLKRHIEDLPDTVTDDLALPECAIAFYDHALEFDARPLYARRTTTTAAPLDPAIRSNLTRESYEAAVGRALDYIRAGDIYQVNLSQRFQAPSPDDPFDVYLRLRAHSPAPFAAFLRYPDFAILSSSPERFLAYDAQGRTAETRPIKGTRPRSSDPVRDSALACELLRSEKDRAENVMIVDLVRNDLGRVAAVGSVEVAALAQLESFANVHHLVSVVRARLQADRDVVDLVRAAFPGGSITGAPKIRAMQIIDELEPVARGVYTGAIGYFCPGGDMDLNIAIRTIVVKDGLASFSVGGGIVADSEPAAEYEETLHKGAAMARVLAPQA